MPRSPLILGTRGSALALWQAEHIRARLVSVGESVVLEKITTTGDRRLDVPLSSIGEKGLFTRELDEALLRGDIHLAVHSLKDLPSTLPTGITLAAVTERTMPFDVLVAGPGVAGGIGQVPEGAVLATSSLRRQSQLRAWRPDLQIEPVRGNVDTRLRKLDENGWHGMILAEAGLVRLGLGDRIRERIPLDVMLPAVGQGALGIVCAGENEMLRDRLRGLLHHDPTARSTTAERAFLRRLEGGCSVPVGAYATVSGNSLTLEGCIGEVDGSTVLRDRTAGDSADAEKLGIALAERLLRAGGGQILARLRRSL